MFSSSTSFLLSLVLFASKCFSTEAYSSYANQLSMNAKAHSSVQVPDTQLFPQNPVQTYDRKIAALIRELENIGNPEPPNSETTHSFGSKTSLPSNQIYCKKRNLIMKKIFVEADGGNLKSKILNTINEVMKARNMECLNKSDISYVRSLSEVQKSSMVMHTAVVSFSSVTVRNKIFSNRSSFGQRSIYIDHDISKAESTKLKSVIQDIKALRKRNGKNIRYIRKGPHLKINGKLYRDFSIPVSSFL
mmetsp:Transcript_21739/g.28136  ORF Transcript_21739/g.28136 Transcript_21739/m.28136 type:complete len:247 (+) Transcript_21739:109-849(+)